MSCTKKLSQQISFELKHLRKELSPTYREIHKHDPKFSGNKDGDTNFSYKEINADSRYFFIRQDEPQIILSVALVKTNTKTPFVSVSIKNAANDTVISSNELTPRDARDLICRITYLAESLGVSEGMTKEKELSFIGGVKSLITGEELPSKNGSLELEQKNFETEMSQVEDCIYGVFQSAQDKYNEFIALQKSVDKAVEDSPEMARLNLAKKELEAAEEALKKKKLEISKEHNFNEAQDDYHSFKVQAEKKLTSYIDKQNEICSQYLRGVTAKSKVRPWNLSNTRSKLHTLLSRGIFFGKILK
ncbi:hypothetical protein [Vibrio sp. D431a]|uniref:hypothetical protein n=1 Tax=Vibrio sp. D431a TaxID=2837388 RepID=UPI00255520E8|nr:hypothetical protein [Vibrio sp. D431a]MDK9789890.1 hypothetical protein [Vibrio sp. D431a]